MANATTPRGARKRKKPKAQEEIARRMPHIFTMCSASERAKRATLRGQNAPRVCAPTAETANLHCRRAGRARNKFRRNECPACLRAPHCVTRSARIAHHDAPRCGRYVCFHHGVTCTSESCKGCSRYPGVSNMHFKGCSSGLSKESRTSRPSKNSLL